MKTRHYFKSIMVLCLFSMLLLNVSAAQAARPTCGSWSVVSSPSPSATGNDLNAVVAISANDIWAVGDTFNYNNGNETSQTLIEQWNGTSWSVVPSPNPGTMTNYLWGVTAVSANNIWVVGNYSNSDRISQTLIEQWNGSQWSVVPSPSPSATGNGFTGVAAISATNIWAVGDYFTSNYASKTLMEQWNGTSWSVVPSPNPNSNENELWGAAAVSASNVWAVGFYRGSGGSLQPLIEHWNGTKWSVVSGPKPGQYGNYLYSVAAVSATNIWAVGSEYANTYYPLVEQWNGRKWKVVPSPNPAGSTYSELKGVTVVSASDVWAVGYYINIDGYSQTLIEQWNGSQWSVIPSANVSGQNNRLSGVAAVSASNVWAVGFSAIRNGSDQTLSEFYC